MNDVMLPRRRRRMRKPVLAAVAGTLGLAGTLLVSPAAFASPVQPCSDMGSVASCVMGILAPANGTHGVYLKQAGGPVIAADNAGFVYEPASSIKPLIALYAITQVEHGTAQLTEQVPRISTSGGPDDCPPSTFSGTESLGNAIQQMLQVSDNNRTDELMRFFGVTSLNNFAQSLGLTNTHFQTATSAPGFNVIGCLSYGYHPLPSTVDGNTMTLTDAATLWADIARLPAPYASTFDMLAAGRDMYNTQGYDFTGIWPAVTGIAQQEAPGMSTARLTAFTDHMTLSVKGGSYQVYDCTGPCHEATWWSFEGTAEIPACYHGQIRETRYTWGYFINDATQPGNASPFNTVAGQAFSNAAGQVLAAPIAKGLAEWASCTVPMATPRVFLQRARVSSGRTVGVTRALATLLDADKTDIPADMVGTINWGDGSATSFATISGGPSRFAVSGWHQYAASGIYPVTIKVTDVQSGSSATLHENISIHP